MNSDIVELAGTNGWNGFSLIQEDPPSWSALDMNGLGPGAHQTRILHGDPGASAREKRLSERAARLRNDRDVEVGFERLRLVRGREAAGTGEDFSTAASAALSHAFTPDSIETNADWTRPSRLRTAWTTHFFPTAGVEAGAFQMPATFWKTCFW